MKRRHKILLTLSAGAIAERYILRPARAHSWAAARRKVRDAATWYWTNGDRHAARHLADRLGRLEPTEEEPF